METPIDGTEIESSDSITKKTDYCIIGPYRFVRGKTALFVATCHMHHRCHRDRTMPVKMAFRRVLQVIPYHFDFVCSVKQRWSGKNIIDIFSKVRCIWIWWSSTSSMLGCLLYRYWTALVFVHSIAIVLAFCDLLSVEQVQYDDCFLINGDAGISSEEPGVL